MKMSDVQGDYARPWVPGRCHVIQKAEEANQKEQNSKGIKLISRYLKKFQMCAEGQREVLKLRVIHLHL